MEISRTHAVTLLLALALLAAACGGLRNGGTRGRIDYPTGTEELVLQVESAGGYVPYSWYLRNLPSFSLYGDGRTVVPEESGEFPAPSLIPLSVRQISEEGIQAILSAASDAGLLGPDRDYGEDVGYADAHTTTFTLSADGASHSVSVYALNPGVGPSDEREVREALLNFLDALAHLDEWLPEGSVSKAEPLAPDAMSIWAHPYEEELLFSIPTDTEQRELPWPLPTGLEEFGEGPDPRCGIVEGADLDQVVEVAMGADEFTAWLSEGGLFAVVFRPVLPGERPCLRR